MHKISCRISDTSIDRNWIQAEKRDWCVYAVEKKLMAVFFFMVIFLMSLCIGVLGQTLIFTVTVYLLRRRVGGWHAPYAWLCQVLSIAVVFGSVLFAGPLLSRIPMEYIWGIDLLCVAISIIQKPVYPPQTHFDQEITAANNRKKIHLLIMIVAIQIILSYFYKEILIYSLLGISVSLILIYIELLHQKLQKELFAK